MREPARKTMSPNRKIDHGNAVEFWVVCFSANDLEPVPCRSRRLGVRYVARQVEQYETDLAWLAADIEALGLGYYLMDAVGIDERATWLLAQGIAPGQPFKVRAERGVYFHDPHTGEWDSEHGDVEVVEIRAWPPARALAAWEAHWRWTTFQVTTKALGALHRAECAPPGSEEAHALYRSLSALEEQVAWRTLPESLMGGIARTSAVRAAIKGNDPTRARYLLDMFVVDAPEELRVALKEAFLTP